MDYALDLHTVGRHVVTQVTDGGEQPPSVAEIATSYRPPNAPDLTRVMASEGIPTPEGAKEWLVCAALEKLDRYIEIVDGIPRWREGHSIETARWERSKLHPLREAEVEHWVGSFDPHRHSGVFSENVRMGLGRKSPLDDELESSLREFGWIPELPAIRDEYGVVLVGHRRLAIAERIGIEPVFMNIVIGDGSAADARRFRIAIASNLGGKPFTPEERKRLATHLYRDAEWSQERIAEALAVSDRTISTDLADVPKRGGTGTRRSNMTTPEWQAAHDPIIRKWINGEIGRDEAVRLGKATGIKPCSNGAYGDRRATLEAAPVSEVASETGAALSPPQTGTNGDGPAETPAPKPVSAPECVCPNCGHHHEREAT